VEDECIIGSFTGSKSPCFAETVVVVELLGSTPLCRERRIGNNRIKLSVAKGISFERIAILYAEIAELDDDEKIEMVFIRCCIIGSTGYAGTVAFRREGRSKYCLGEV